MRECPQCGGDIWDNTAKVDDGWRGPLYKCKDDDCGWVKWPKKQQRKKSGQKGGGPKWTWGRLSQMYENCLLIAQKHLNAHVEAAEPVDVIAATATLFIAATRDGVRPAKPKPKPEPEPEPEQEEEGDDDLPF